ncbi:MAG: ImmA/IrrE family metallo-endopeptidase [Oscillospiraceae bacterium]
MQHIIDEARLVREEYGGRDVFETAENSGVKVWFRQLGSLKGFYLCENGVRYIIINEALDRSEKRVVCAHELGHDRLHRELSAGGIRENTMLLSCDKTEREANLFAAELLISDEEILSELEYCRDIDMVAYELGFPRELISLKLELLNFAGGSFTVGETESCFLR